MSPSEVTAAFGPSGRTLGQIGLGVTGFVDARVPAALALTPIPAGVKGCSWAFVLLALFNIRLDRKQAIGHQEPLNTD